MAATSFTRGEVDSLVEPAAEEVGLSAVAAVFGSHAHPRLHADGVWNHARARGSICRKRHLQPARTGEYEYLPRAKTHVRAKACKFFTDDGIRQRRFPFGHTARGEGR